MHFRPPASPPAPLAELEREARARVRAASTGFLRRFLNTWIAIGLALLAYVFVVLPELVFIVVTLLGASVAARFALHRRWTGIARWLFLVPITVLVFSVPPTLNGVRSPLLMAVPLLIMIYGWLLGRRAMAVFTGIAVLGIAGMALVEHLGIWSMPQPLRPPQVWTLTLFTLAGLTALTTGALLRSYQANSRRELELRQELAATAHFAETLLLDSPLPMRVFDADGYCIKTNVAYAQLVGVPYAQLLGQNFRDIVMWQASGLVADCERALATMTPVQRELAATTSTGKTLWIDVHLLPVEHHGERSLLVQCVDLTERKQMSETLESLAFHDPLTELPNRRLFFDRFEHALQKSRRRRTWGAVMLIDLDRFKQLNDTHGHEAGDRYLREVASRLRGTLRITDTPARIGGDEFAVLLEDLGTDREHAWIRAERLANKIEEVLAAPWSTGGVVHDGTASVGYELFSDQERRSAGELLHAADASMYASKRGAVTAAVAPLPHPERGGAA